ncbi:hypothetical protein B0H13DRAFT_1896661 [Mycena leptocephala]|nr:hypothetical protein B0H13DRAFT_1896661 [Mycena leptocephala]
MLPNCLVSPDQFSTPTFAKLLQDSPEFPMDHAPVATTPDERPESPVNVDDDKHVQLTVANQGSLTSDCDVPLTMQGHRPDLKVEVQVNGWEWRRASEYLAHREVDNPMLLCKRKSLIEVWLRASKK